MPLLQHSSTYNNFKITNKKENNEPEKIKFWENSDATRRKIISWHKDLINLVKAWSKEKDVDEKNEILNDIYQVVINVLNKTRQYRQYYEARLLYMQIEKILMKNGINPVNIRGSMEDKYDDEDAGDN